MRRIEIPEGEVQLWWASLDVSASDVHRLRKYLAPLELQRADRFRVASAARRFIVARAALRTVLASATGTAPEDIEFAFGPHGKPRLAAGGPHFNASDSGEFVVIALTHAEVGVDIEAQRRLARHDRLAHRICTERELDLLERTPREERHDLLLRLWTCKEAALKAIGTGLLGGTRNVEVELPAGGPQRLNRLPGGADGWSLLFPNLHPQLLCSVVVRGFGFRTVGHTFSLDGTVTKS
jgi:4'-phosphopantetheinyl transferase